MTQATSKGRAASPPDPTEQPPGSELTAGHPLRAGEDTAELATLAVHMELPGTRLDMVLGGPHPLLLDIVRSLARRAAQAHYATTAGASSVLPKQAGASRKDT